MYVHNMDECDASCSVARLTAWALPRKLVSGLLHDLLLQTLVFLVEAFSSDPLIVQSSILHLLI